ncbi:hypothetical protein B0H17DRAFT_1126311 [Mycena rosella]|uniref:Uncharacterized protein n=1 Tax=Mycena rosella TaxID=1033263 RepID=A0AAD7M8E8_MYCRO|nr:hypothetical protein B0H17DRAFT_1126311 [Mycena rosella]
MSPIMLVPATSPELKAQCIEIRKFGYFHIDEGNQPQVVSAQVFDCPMRSVLTLSFMEDPVASHFLLADSAKIDAVRPPSRVSEETGTVQDSSTRRKPGFSNRRDSMSWNSKRRSELLDSTRDGDIRAKEANRISGSGRRIC